jgi:hypothetical protein
MAHAQLLLLTSFALLSSLGLVLLARRLRLQRQQTRLLRRARR